MPKAPTEVSGNFGKLTVVHCNLPPKKRVLVRCECGKEFATNSYSLLNGRTNSCGATTCSTRARDLTGKKFGFFTVVSLSDVKDKRGNLIWNCKCICGKDHRVLSWHLIKGLTKSCGCQEGMLRSLKSTKPAETVFLNTHLCKYRSGAKYRNISFNLTIDQMKPFLFGNCHYCGVEPLASFVIPNIQGDRIIKYNGIDRIDSSCGYEIDNCVSCCKICNVAKRDLSVSDFMKWIEKIYKHSSERGIFNNTESMP